MPKTPEITLFYRDGCHLCEQMYRQLCQTLSETLVASISLHDVDSCQQWFDEYDSRVPVLLVNNRVVAEYHLDIDRLQIILNGQDDAL